MESYKVVLITSVAPELREMFIAGAPSNMWVKLCTLSTGKEEEIAEVAKEVNDADFIIIHRGTPVTGIPNELIRDATKLKLFQTTAQGTDRLPLSLASEMGIPISNGGGLNAIDVAEHTVLLMMATLKQFLTSVETTRYGKGNVVLDIKDIHRLSNKTVGIIGLGNIGKCVAKMLIGFGTETIFYDTVVVPEAVSKELNARQVSLDTVLSTSDIVALLVPLTDSTRGMIGLKQLAMMKPSAILINTSRGGVVDEGALIRVLQEKKIAGAGLDVFSTDPPNIDNPLLHMVNVVPTPHIAGHSWENWLLLIKRTWENLQRVAEGKEALNVVNKPQTPPNNRKAK